MHMYDLPFQRSIWLLYISSRAYAWSLSELPFFSSFHGPLPRGLILNLSPPRVGLFKWSQHLSGEGITPHRDCLHPINTVWLPIIWDHTIDAVWHPINFDWHRLTPFLTFFDFLTFSTPHSIFRHPFNTEWHPTNSDRYLINTFWTFSTPTDTKWHPSDSDYMPSDTLGQFYRRKLSPN